MIALEEIVSLVKPESSLLMSYCANLSFFERDLLPHLQRVGAGTVTVLLDEAEYDSTFADLAKSVGIRYQLRPVRLPHRAANFHPKLYLLNTSETATLLVASANLTPSGFRSNLEVVDQLTLSPARIEDASAFGQYAQMLRILPTLDKRLPEPVKKDLINFASDLERRGAVAHISEKGPWFLHTVAEALLPQLLRLVPPIEVTTITAISPFFDETSMAILELAGAYPNAKIRLITDTDSGALNGPPLAKLGNRIKVEGLTSETDPKRRLHAKLLILSGRKREWVVSGSANLTRAAWLAAAQSSKCGNVEAVIVRMLDGGDSARLTIGLETRTVEYLSLRREAIPPTAEAGEAGRLILIDAEVRSGQITIRLERGPWYHESVSFTVLTDQGGKRSEYDPVLVEAEDRLCLGVRLGRQAIADTPIALTVLVHTTSGTFLQARAWVASPGLLAMNSSQRQIRGDVRDVCGSVFGRDEDAAAVSEAFSQFLTELGQLSRQRTPVAPAGGSKHSSDEETDQPIFSSDFIVSDSALGSLQSSHSRMIQAFSGLALLLQKVLVDVIDVGDDEEPRDPVSEEDQESDTDQKKKRVGDSKANKKKAATLLTQIGGEISNAIYQCLRQPVGENTLPFILAIPQTVIAYLQLHGIVNTRLKLNTGHGLAFTIRDALNRIFSIGGILSGGSFGWLIRASSIAKCNNAMSKHLTDVKRLDDLLLLVGAGLAIDGPLSATDTVAWSILAGLHLVCGKDPSAITEETVVQQLKMTGRSSIGTVSVAQIVKTLRSYDRLNDKLLPLVRFWTNALDGKDHDSGGLRKPQRMSLTHIDIGESGVSCRSCSKVLPTNISMHFPPHEIEEIQCCNCHRLIVPLAPKDDTVDRVLLWLGSFPGESR
jgi:hypothetical protein